MCGICGVLRFDGTPVDPAHLEAMSRTLAHRGPDDSGLITNGVVGLAHRRLSIIDLSEHGRQPMRNEDGSILLVCNGEIYNYRELRDELAARGHVFYSHSDNEVIIHGYEEWGEAAWAKLEGMFAFALWDKKRTGLYLVRDPMGIKPLFYLADHEKLLFGSEIKAILAYPEVRPQLDPESLSAFLSYFYVPQPRTILRGIRHVQAGHSLRAQKGTLTETPYWELQFDPRAVITDEREVLAGLRATIASCVKKSLVSDVPVGLLLSAGMDSTILLHEMAQVYPGRIKTFTVSFDEPSYDESTPARAMAERYGTEHHDIRFSPADVMRELDSMLLNFDSLSANPVCLPFYFVAKLASRHVKVAVIGSGGDELFAGYETYRADAIAARLRGLPAFAKRALLAAAARLPVSQRYLGLDYKLRKFAEGLFFPPGKSHYWWRTVFTDAEKAQLFSPGLLAAAGDLDCYRYYARRIAEAACLPGDPDRFLYADLRMFLGDNALTLVDMMSMAHALEVRPPFLLPDLVDFSFRIPFSMKVRGKHLKYCLRKAYARDLPPFITRMPKRGFNAPLGMMINGPLKAWVTETLCAGGLREAGLFEGSAVRGLLGEQFARRMDHSYKLWALVCFARWHELFGRPAI